MAIYKQKRYFAWVDTETNGLNLQFDVPVEVALVITDEKLQIQIEYESLIAHSAGLFFESAVSAAEWWNAQEGTKIHKIPFDEIKAATALCTVAEQIDRICSRFWIGPIRPTLISDNPVFDWIMLQKLPFESWPFHYNAWSPLLLWNAVGLRPQPRVHRAMPDVQSMIKQTKLALSLIQRIEMPFFPEF